MFLGQDWRFPGIEAMALVLVDWRRAKSDIFMFRVQPSSLEKAK